MFSDADQHRCWLAIARRYTPAGIDAADVLQEACIAAMKARRTDLSSPPDQRYFRGILRKTAWAMRRADVRRRRHEHAQPPDAAPRAANEPASAPDLSMLPQSLQAVANLVMADLDRNEIRSALGISDDALRRRLSDLRRYIEAHLLGFEEFESALRARQQLAPSDVGLMRQTLVYWLQRRPQPQGAIGTLDPDGHLIGLTRKAGKELTNPDRPATEG